MMEKQFNRIDVIQIEVEFQVYRLYSAYRF